MKLRSQLHNYLLSVCWCAALHFQTLKFNQRGLSRSNLFKEAQQDSQKQFHKIFQEGSAVMLSPLCHPSKPPLFWHPCTGWGPSPFLPPFDPSGHLKSCKWVWWGLREGQRPWWAAQWTQQPPHLHQQCPQQTISQHKHIHLCTYIPSENTPTSPF